MSSVAALIVLIILFILIFCILGMNIFGANIMDDPELVYNGSSVFVRLPWEPGGELRYGTVIQMDHFNHTNTPWRVAIRFGTEQSVQDAIQLPPTGAFWAAVGEDAGLGVSSFPLISFAVSRCGVLELTRPVCALLRRCRRLSGCRRE
eukprot:3491081-Rhodomonas_salina.3